jgi:hypothetical protein
MQIYKFDTHIDNNGIITLPENLNLKDLDVEIIINTKDKNKITGKEFVKKWKGIAKGVDPDKAKFDYLMEKHK